MNKLIVFVLHNNINFLNEIKDRNFIEKINLNKLPLDEIYKKNELAENRFFIYLKNNLNLIKNYDYIGIASARWNEKYNVHTEKKIIPIENLGITIEKLKNNHVYVAAPTNDWYKESCYHHAGINLYLDELLKRNNFNKDKISFYSNNFICKKSILLEFLTWWVTEFNFFFKKYGLSYNFNSSNFHDYKENVNCAYFYERLTIAYFANKNYIIEELNQEKFNSLNNFSRKITLNKFNKINKFY